MAARNPAGLEKPARCRTVSVPGDGPGTSGGHLLRNQLTHVNVWVHDQDEALAFCTSS